MNLVSNLQTRIVRCISLKTVQTNIHLTWYDRCLVLEITADCRTQAEIAET